MDILCSRCGEPWDNDTFHDVAEEQGITYREAVRRFQADGCGATGWCDPCEPVHNNRTAVAGMLYDLLGDDVDGAAAMLDDADWMGVLD